jgi:hypothetical protein
LRIIHSDWKISSQNIVPNNPPRIENGSILQLLPGEWTCYVSKPFSFYYCCPIRTFRQIKVRSYF